MDFYMDFYKMMRILLREQQKCLTCVGTTLLYYIRQVPVHIAMGMLPCYRTSNKRVTGFRLDWDLIRHNYSGI